MLETLQSAYGLINPKPERLAGYDIVNYKIKSQSGENIVKIYPNKKKEIDFAEAENDVLLHLQKKKNNKYPVPIHNTEGKLLTPIKNENKSVRLLSYLTGTFFMEAPHNKEMFRSLGKFLAEMDLQLHDFRNYVIEARQIKWDLKNFLLNEKHICHISDPEKKKVVEYYFQQYKENVLPVLPSLRMQIIHSDANDMNLLTANNAISGIIDFGDICYSHLINELAIALEYALMGKEDPLEWANPVISEYCRALPLEERELDVLYWLIAARTCTTLCSSAFELSNQPDNSYTQESEKPAWELLQKWITINPVLACNEFREAAGYKKMEEKSAEEVKYNRFKSVSPIFSVSYIKPIYLERAAFQYMFDKYGNTYLDAYNNIPHVGHSHPKVVDAGQRQMARLNTNTRYLYDQLNEYTLHLLGYFPKPLNKIFLVNSGSAASDLAIRMARNFTGKKRIAALEHGYHGNTNSVIEVSHYKFAGKGGKGAGKNVLPLPMPDTYRGEFKTVDAGTSYGGQAIQKINESEERLAAFIAEPIVGCGGQVPLAQGYLKEVYNAVRKQGGICISDEVQTGFGRLGDVFWGYEMYDVVPDMVILGKPMGNGHPIGAVVTTDEIAEAFDNGMEFFSSFGGNPVSCAIGKAVLDTMEDEQLQQNAKQVGDHYLEQLRELQVKHECIGDVRGSGLFIGFEFVKNRLSLEPDTELAQKVKNELRNQYVLVSTDGPYENVIKSKPPLCFKKENVDEVICKLQQILLKSSG